MIIRSLISGLLAFIGTTTVALSQEPSPIGSFREWNAYTFAGSDVKACFIASQPTSSKYSQNISGRDPVFLFVTMWVASDPTKSVQNEVSAIIGYPFKPSSNVTADIDGKKFTLFTRADNAWFNDRNSESAFVEAMKAGNTMTIQGSSGRGTITTDTYSLSGVTAALEAIAKACL